MIRFRFLLLVLAVAWGASWRPVAASTTAYFNNQSRKPWIVKVMPNGKSTGGYVEVGGTKQSIWDEFTIPKEQQVEVKFNYTVSYALRLQIRDYRGNWIEVASQLGIGEVFLKSPRYQRLYNSINDTTFSKCDEVIVLDKTVYQENGDITIRKDSLSEVESGPTGYQTRDKPVLLDPPFVSCFLFNRSTGTYTLAATGVRYGQPVAPVGRLIFTDALGTKLGELDPAKPMPLPPGAYRMLWVPAKGQFSMDVTLRDPAQLELKFNFIIEKGEGGIVISDDQDKRRVSSVMATQSTTPYLALNAFPATLDLTILGNGFPAAKW